MADGRRRHESQAERRARRAEVDHPEVVLAVALRFLETRARSAAETGRRLTEAGYRPELVEAAIERLLAIGLLDDEAFARQWVESRDRARPRAEAALKRELRLRGVDGAVIDVVLEARRADGDDRERQGDPEEAAARRLLERRRRDLQRVADPRKRRARAYALLARNGFGPEIASRVAAGVDTSVPDADEDDPGPS